VQLYIKRKDYAPSKLLEIKYQADGKIIFKKNYDTNVQDFYENGELVLSEDIINQKKKMYYKDGSLICQRIKKNGVWETTEHVYKDSGCITI
jgi:antitoxin component YwqK of YwqJK toxin-antitoxin module